VSVRGERVGEGEREREGETKIYKDISIDILRDRSIDR
jgi:hypothetical protein